MIRYKSFAEDEKSESDRLRFLEFQRRSEMIGLRRTKTEKTFKKKFLTSTKRYDRMNELLLRQERRVPETERTLITEQ